MVHAGGILAKVVLAKVVGNIGFCVWVMRYDHLGTKSSVVRYASACTHLVDIGQRDKGLSIRSLRLEVSVFQVTELTTIVFDLSLM